MLADEMKIDLEKTANNIKLFMKQQNLSQSELGRITGLARGCISNYTNGYNPPSLVNLGVLAEVFNTNISEIIVYKKESDSENGTGNTKTVKKNHF